MKTQSKIVRFFMPSAYVFREYFYSPVIYFFLWLFSFRSKYKKHIREWGKPDLRRDNLKNIPENKFYILLKGIPWKSEKWGGAIDFTYRETGMLQVPEIYKKWGRDCDDLSNLTYNYCKKRGWYKVYQVLLTTGGLLKAIKESHFITLAQHSEDSFINIFDNNSIINTPYSDPTKVMEIYAEERQKSRGHKHPTVWYVCKK